MSKQVKQVYRYDVEHSNCQLECYENLLNIFSQWHSVKRDIKLTSLLEGQKVKFDIEEIQNSGALWGLVADKRTANGSRSLEEVCFAIKNMTFILNGNSLERLTLGIIPLSTKNGKILESLIKDQIEFKIHQFIEKGQILYFYVDFNN